MYQLIDFGDGLKLESLSGHTIVRPSPAAELSRRALRDRWSTYRSIYELPRKAWTHNRPWPADLMIDCGNFRMPVHPTPFGHIGVFPEQFENWKWLQQRRPTPPVGNARPLALNLFAYTGASTIALALAGYDVVHVDAAKPNVAAAKQSVDANGLAGVSIRYMVDDAAKFTAREVRRERKYGTIVLDPPAYGHTPKGKTWRIERDLWPLLENCLRLVDPAGFRLLVTGHSPQVVAGDVIKYFQQASLTKRFSVAFDSGRSVLKDLSGRSLDAGFFVRVEAPGSIQAQA
ncbi:23S rRNA m(2)G2445 methyltransferase [Novipirellula aureliae]|uniref:23S rRNA m(2)G2445 methyltransferase n=1 Tax=Novipirellula aureliae TaxID=2527966 RepID=A0A5C6E651_9BACT|nr:class I SAM-dependent methyltransferase [Novipirellula aureliae]TWU44054.1 23S rRNA m(2)G2445 methyltransferase [Novipirellula aureliae]